MYKVASTLVNILEVQLNWSFGKGHNSIYLQNYFFTIIMFY